MLWNLLYCTKHRIFWIFLYKVYLKSAFPLKIGIFLCFKGQSACHRKGSHVPHLTGFNACILRVYLWLLPCCCCAVLPTFWFKLKVARMCNFCQFFECCQLLWKQIGWLKPQDYILCVHLCIISLLFSHQFWLLFKAWLFFYSCHFSLMNSKLKKIDNSI